MKGRRSAVVRVAGVSFSSPRLIGSACAASLVCGILAVVLASPPSTDAGRVTEPAAGTVVLPYQATSPLASTPVTPATTAANLSSRTPAKAQTAAQATVRATAQTASAVTSSTSPATGRGRRRSGTGGATSPLPTAVSQALAPGAWTLRQTVASAPITDARGDLWSAPTGLVGGANAYNSGGIGDTASQDLYQTNRVGAAHWVVTVPRPGRYAIDLLVSDINSGDVAGSNVFDVLAGGGLGVDQLAAGLDVVSRVGIFHPYHVTGLVDVTGTKLLLGFPASAGSALVDGLKVTSDGAAAALHTTLAESFDGAAGTAPDPSVWTPNIGSGWEGSDGLEYYTDSRANSALDGSGNLVLTALPQQTVAGDGTVTQYTSAELRTAGKFTFGYGHVDATMKVPGGSGVWPALWAKGADEDTVDWPRCGEIDIMEDFAAFTDDVSSHVHSYGDAQDPTTGYKDQPEATQGIDHDLGVDPTQSFHDYAIDYMPGAITFSVDADRYFTAAPEDYRAGEEWPFDGQQMYLLMDLAVGDTSATGTPTASTEFPAKLLVSNLTVSPVLSVRPGARHPSG